MIFLTDLSTTLTQPTLTISFLRLLYCTPISNAQQIEQNNSFKEKKCQDYQ